MYLIRFNKNIVSYFIASKKTKKHCKCMAFCFLMLCHLFKIIVKIYFIFIYYYFFIFLFKKNKTKFTWSTLYIFIKTHFNKKPKQQQNIFSVVELKTMGKFV